MFNFLLRDLPKQLKLLISSFLLALLFGYGASFLILSDTTNLTPSGIEESYNGNEDDEDAEMLKFRKSRFEILTTVHSHVFTLGVLFLITGFLTWFTALGNGIKTFLMVEPLISLILSFGSLIMMWLGLSEFKYLAFLSGMLMHSTFLLTIALLYLELFRKQENSTP